MGLEKNYQRLTNNHEFLFSKREFFSTFNRRELSHAYNMVLTIAAKILIYSTWDCRNKNYLPELENCWAFIEDRTTQLGNSNRNFKKLWDSSGLQNTFP
jgi:hypothetical protein